MTNKISRLLKRVNNTVENEINCSVCLEQISRYVDLELATGQAGQRMPQVAQHLGQCGVCHEEYQMLHELAVLESQGGLPSNDVLKNRLKGQSK
ncbi:MAG: hypothetical protein AAGU05_06180 [Anaerolineaceae bacterium]